MAIAMLIIVATLACLGAFAFKSVDRILAVTIFFISGLWLLRSDEIPDGGEGVKLVLANLAMLILALLVIRVIGSLLFGPP